MIRINHTKIVLVLIVLFLFISLVLLNRDLYYFTFDARCECTYVSDMDEEKDYVVLGPIALKPGSYVLSPQVSTTGDGNGIFMIDGDDKEVFYADLPDGGVNPSFPFEISGSSKQVRIGIRFFGDQSKVEMSRIIITAEHVLYRESVLRHLTVSIVIIFFAVWLILRLCYPAALWKIFPLFANPENELVLGMLIILTIAACYPILNGKVYIHGDDMFFHVTRIRGISDSLKAGYFPVRNQLYWLNNYGYGVGFFYPDVFLYFPAGLLLLGFDQMTAYNIFLIVCTFLSLTSIWYTGIKITKNRTAAAAAAIMMAFAAYRLIIVYYRAAIGEVQSATFFPLIILGLYDIFSGHNEKWPVFAFGFLGIACCHLISLAMATVITAVFLLTQIHKITRDRNIFFALVKSVLLVIGISAFFWIPMLEQNLTNPGLKINNVLSGTSGMNEFNYAFPVRNLFVRFKTWDWMWQAGAVYPGLTFWLTLVFGIAVFKNRSGSVHIADIILICSLPFLWMSTRSFPWHWKIFLPLVIRIQFAYRFLLPVTVMMSLSGGIYFSALVKNRKPYFWTALLVLFCFFTTGYPILQESAQHRAVEKRMFIMQDNRVSGEEYLPVGLDKDYPGKNADTVHLYEENIPLVITEHKRRKLSFRFSYEIPEEVGEVHFSVPLIYYTGYRGVLTADDGTIIEPEITWDERGLVSLSNHGLSHGSVFISYEKTYLQKIGEFITLVTLCSYLGKKKNFAAL